VSEYGEPWHVVREMVYNGPDADVTHLAADHDPLEPDQGILVLESADPARLTRAVACVNVLAGVPDAVLAGRGIDDVLFGLMRTMLRSPADVGAQCALADRLLELTADLPAGSPDTPVTSTAESVASVTPGTGTPSPGGTTYAEPTGAK
jgi:hypothetical protein